MVHIVHHLCDYHQCCCQNGWEAQPHRHIIGPCLMIMLMDVGNCPKAELPREKFCYRWLHRRLLRRYRPQSAVNCSTLWEQTTGSQPSTSQVSLTILHVVLIACITPNNHWLNLFFFSTGASLRHNKLGIYDSLELTPTTQLEHTYTQAHKHTHIPKTLTKTQTHTCNANPHTRSHTQDYTHTATRTSPLASPKQTHTHTKLFHPHTHMSNLSKKNVIHFSICVCHPCAGAMLIFSVSFQF